jgi:hypothetical protein
MRGRWRIVEMEARDADFVDLMGPAHIQFDDSGGDFAFGCVAGAIYGSSDSNAISFTWTGNNEMDEAFGEGWAELQHDGSLMGEIIFHEGDQSTFIARPWATFSAAC